MKWDFRGTRERIRPHILHTPLLHAPILSEMAGREVWLKLETLQRTGSFKLRGAASRITALSDEERSQGVLAVSSGNHGRAVSLMARRLGVPATIFVPRWVDPVKLEAMRANGAEVRLEGDTYDESAEAAELERARRAQEARGRGPAFVHPFDDPWIIQGQGTMALEILEDLPGVAEVALALSGGGLVAGVAQALHQEAPGVRVTAVTARNARAMWESQRAGHPVDVPEEETLAWALAGGVGMDNRYTFGLVRDRVHRHVVVDEGEIACAMAMAFSDLRLVVEGAGAVPLAALQAGELTPIPDAPDPHGPLVLVLSGGNLDLAVLSRILTGTVPTGSGPPPTGPGPAGSTPR